MDTAPITGHAYQADTPEVHTYIIKSTLGNPGAEAKLVPHAQHNNERLDFIALKNHYKGFGADVINIFQADKVLQNIFYVGKNSNMWWD